MGSEPKIYLINRPSFSTDGVNSFLDTVHTSWEKAQDTTDAEKIIEFAARICYMSFGDRQLKKTSDEFIKDLIRRGHESVLEHASWTFLITNVSRAFSHQLVRHRIGFSFSQLSQQYYLKFDNDFISPSLLEQSPDLELIWRDAIDKSKRSSQKIKKLLEKIESQNEGDSLSKERRRAINSAARSILPNASETKIVVTANARALRHFLAIRGSIIGDEEMRWVCSKLLNILKKEAPSVFYDFELEHLADERIPIVYKVKEKKT